MPIIVIIITDIKYKINTLYQKNYIKITIIIKYIKTIYTKLKKRLVSDKS